MARVAKVAVDLETNSAKFTSGLNRADKALAASSYKWQRTLSKMERKMSAVGGVIGTVMAGVAAGSVVGALYDVNAEFQKLSASLKTVTGSSAGAQAAMDMIRNFASETPYQLSQVTEAFIKLKAMGLDTSVESLRSFGNTASAMGKPIGMMIEAVADAATGEFERLKEFGIKASSEGDKVTFTFQGMKTTVGKNATEIENYLRRLGEVQFAGAMTEQMSTLGGQASNLKDQFDALMFAIGEAGANGVMSSALKGFTIWTKALTASINEFVTVEARLNRVNKELAKETSWTNRILSAPLDLITYSMKPLFPGLKTSYDASDSFAAEKKGLEELIAVQKEAQTISEERLRLEDLLESEKKERASKQPMPEEIKKAEKIQKQIASLKFQEEQLSRTARAQAVYAELQKAGIDISSQEGQQIAASAGKLYDKTKAVETARAAQEALVEKQKEQQEAREKVTSGITQEIADNEKLIAALKVSEAEYERVAAMLELVNSFRQAGVELSPEEIKKAEKLTETLGNQRTQLDGLKEKAESLKSLGADMGMTFASAFEDAIIEGKKLSDVLESLYQDILRLMVRQSMTQPLASMGSGLFSSLLGSIGSAVGFASGTSSAPPGMAWVGEKGPELVKFRGGEQVFPADISKLISGGFRVPAFASGAYDSAALSDINVSGGGVTVNVINKNNSSVKTNSRQSGGGLEIDVMIDQAVAKNIATSGSKTNQALGNYSSRSLVRR